MNDTKFPGNVKKIRSMAVLFQKNKTANNNCVQKIFVRIQLN